VRENLPWSGYGQGDVLATPLRMARVAAAIGTDGQIREPALWGQTGNPGLASSLPPAAPRTFLPESSARLLASYMRDVVSSGTGRALRSHRVRIAGKTGTAEVANARSHSWFVGFAPADGSTRRVAFAVILENAGYGGSGAASVAGQIVTSAAELGLLP
jgi:peptidoglycan glycosyltransferase